MAELFESMTTMPKEIAKVIATATAARIAASPVGVDGWA
jgi:hypothetical protein